MLDTFIIAHISRKKNGRANFLAQQASDYKTERGQFFVQNKLMLEWIFNINGGGSGHEQQEAEQPNDMVIVDLRKPLIECLQNPSSTKDRTVRRQVLKYTLMVDELYLRMIDGLLLKCLNEESKIAMVMCMRVCVV
jgi:hypothetical protein